MPYNIDIMLNTFSGLGGLAGIALAGNGASEMRSALALIPFEVHLNHMASRQFGLLRINVN